MGDFFVLIYGRNRANWGFFFLVFFFFWLRSFLRSSRQKITCPPRGIESLFADERFEIVKFKL